MSPIYFDYYDSPIGLIEIAGTSTAVIALNFVAERCREVASHSLVAEAVRQLDEYFDGKRRDIRILKWPLKEPISSSRSGNNWRQCLMAALHPTRTLREAWDDRPPSEPSAQPTAATRSPSWFPVTASSVKTAIWSDTAADCGARNGFSNTKDIRYPRSAAENRLRRCKVERFYRDFPFGQRAKNQLTVQKTAIHPVPRIVATTERRDDRFHAISTHFTVPGS